MFVFACTLDSFLSCTETLSTDKLHNGLVPSLRTPLICASALCGVKLPCIQDVDCTELCWFHCSLTNDDTALCFSRYDDANKLYDSILQDDPTNTVSKEIKSSSLCFNCIVSNGLKFFGASHATVSWTLSFPLSVCLSVGVVTCCPVILLQLCCFLSLECWVHFFN